MARLPRRLYLAVLLSGASGLTYEVLWSRALARHFGTTVSAVTTTVAAFMGGMTLGALLFGRLADRSRQPLRLYCNVEFGIALSAVSISLLLLRGDALLRPLAQWSEAFGPLSGALRFCTFALLLLVPSTGIGATLIVLSRALTTEGHAGRAVGSLYAINTAGAVLGTALPDFVLIPSVGLTATALVASVGNLCAAMLVAGLPERAAPARDRDPAGERTSGPLVGTVSLYALSGCCGMAAEVLWSRTLEHWAAALVTSFAVLLGVYLTALALGSFATRRLADRVSNPLAWATFCLGLLGPALLLPIACSSEWRDVQRVWLPRPVDVARPSMWYETLNASMHAVYLEGAACLLMGAAFPFLAAASIREGRSGAQTGMLYSANTLAGVLGSVIAGFLWLPALGELYSLCAVACLAALGAAVFALLHPGRAQRLLALAALALTLGIVWIVPSDLAQRSAFRGAGRIIALREGTTTTAAVSQHFEFGLPSFKELVTPGVSMSDTSFGARRYMAMMGHLAAFFGDRPERALLICYGVGNTADALLSHPDMKRLDVVDISSEVLSLSPELSTSRGRDPLRDPRTHVFVDDGRHHLLTRAISYDVITSEPPPPNHAGVVNLYTREYYRVAKARLRPRGVLTQWLPVFQLSAPDTLTIIAAFTAELPYSALFYGYKHEWILVGSAQPLRIAPNRWRARADVPSVAASLQDVGIDAVSTLYGAMLASDAQLRELVRSVPILSDDAPSIEYPRTDVRSPFRLSPSASPAALALALFAQPATDEEVALSNRAAHTTRIAIGLLDRLSLLPTELWEARAATALAEVALPGTGREAVLALIGADGQTALLAERLLSQHPNPRAALAGQMRVPQRERQALQDAVLALARRALYTGRPRHALEFLQLLPEGPGRDARHAWLVGKAARAVGERDVAIRAFEQALSLSKNAEFAREVQQALSHTRAASSAPN